MYRFVSFVALGLFVGGCASAPEKLEQPTASGTNVEFSNSAAQQGVIGFVPTGVQTMKSAAGITIRTQEQSFPAQCELTGEGFSVKFQTPATVNLPSYGDVKKPVTLKCTDGDTTREQSYKVVNLSKQNRTGNAIAVGILLSPLAGGIMAGVGSTPQDKDVFGYPDMKMSF